MPRRDRARGRSSSWPSTGVLSERFVAVHATNLAPHEARLLGEARAFACICPTTERDLGDGLPDLGSARGAGARLCTGVDSHVLVDPIEDLRSLETHERLRTRRRITAVTDATGPWQTPAERLWRAGSVEGDAACGFGRELDGSLAPLDHPRPGSLAPLDHSLS